MNEAAANALYEAERAGVKQIKGRLWPSDQIGRCAVGHLVAIALCDLPSGLMIACPRCDFTIVQPCAVALIRALQAEVAELRAGKAGEVHAPASAERSDDAPEGPSALADFALNRPRAFAALTDAEVCRGTAVERVKCRNGAGNCAREFNCAD